MTEVQSLQDRIYELENEIRVLKAQMNEEREDAERLADSLESRVHELVRCLDNIRDEIGSTL